MKVLVHLQLVRETHPSSHCYQNQANNKKEVKFCLENNEATGVREVIIQRQCSSQVKMGTELSLSSLWQWQMRAGFKFLGRTLHN